MLVSLQNDSETLRDMENLIFENTVIQYGKGVGEGGEQS